MGAAPLVGGIVTGLGGILGGVGAIRGGAAEANAANYNAQVAEQNATLARQQAAEEERKSRVQSKKELGAARANYGASGITLEGSPLDSLEESAAAAELDALQIRHSGEVKARAFEGQANLERYRGKNAKTQGYLGGAASLLQGGAGVAGFLK